MKIWALMFAAVQTIILMVQIGTLVDRQWTTWDLRFNWTRASGDFNRRPTADGQLVSEGHAGLWSRCIKVYSIDETGKDLEIKTEKCLQNYENGNMTMLNTFGKICKTAAAGLCVIELPVTCALLVMTAMMVYWRKGRNLAIPALVLLVVQGAIFFAIPLTYIVGNMAELIDHLSAAYGLLLIVGMTVDYSHDYSVSMQVALRVQSRLLFAANEVVPDSDFGQYQAQSMVQLAGTWLVASALYTILYNKVNSTKEALSSRTNGEATSGPAEMEPLRNRK